MINPPKTLLVYDDFSRDQSVLMGYLFIERKKGTESYKFTYETDWLAQTHLTLQLDPELRPRLGNSTSTSLFGLFTDASPEQWGQRLLKQKERQLADKDGRKPSKLYPTDFLLSVDDATRLGGLRFRDKPLDTFLTNDQHAQVASWEDLPSLEKLAWHFENDANTLSENELLQLIHAGTALGGTRPKATIVGRDQTLWIAKFPSKWDGHDTGAWEMVVHDLALHCGLSVPEARLERFSTRGSTFLTKRFDRAGKRRIHFASAQTLLGKPPSPSEIDARSYLDLVAFIRAQGAEPKRDLSELWKRIVFNMAVHNTDDHLRNHGFILGPSGWVLSPLYDVNPVPNGDELSLNVNEYDNRIHIALAVQTAERFGIPKSTAIAYAESIKQIVREHWERIATQYGLSREQIEAMRPAFNANFE